VRYVRISWSGCAHTPDPHGFLNLAELQYLSNGSNVALNKPSSSSGAFAGSDASRLVDGSVSTVFQSDITGADVFWEVDLQVRGGPAGWAAHQQGAHCI
jgi:hypothetical protein